METQPTSIAAYTAIKQSGLLSKQRFEVYEALVKHGPMTAGEVTRLLLKESQGNPSYHRRLDELEEQGVVERREVRACSVSGCEAFVWHVVDALPRPYKPKRNIKNLRKTLVAMQDGDVVICQNGELVLISGEKAAALRELAA